VEPVQDVGSGGVSAEQRTQLSSVIFDEFVQIAGRSSASWRAADGFQIELVSLQNGCFVQVRNGESTALLPYSRIKSSVAK
jgi:hypothetical protein